MQTLYIYTRQKSARLEYICALIFEEMLGLSIICTDHLESCPHNDQIIQLSISNDNSNIPFLKIDPFILQSHYQKVTPNVSTHRELPILFEHKDTTSILPFCLLSTCFYLVSRYEEYSSEGRDQHGRFSPTNSLAYQHHFLNIPLIDHWANHLKEVLRSYFPSITYKETTFRLTPTYDIDHGYAFSQKPIGRQCLSAFKNIVKADFTRLRLQWMTHFNRIKDPFDTYDSIMQSNERLGLFPIFFWLLADLSTYDRNIAHTNSVFIDQIKAIQNKYECGIHPSYASYESPDTIQMEVDRLQTIIGQQVTKSRQHFVRFNLPNTYRQLLQVGIQHDYSMGYAQQNGFRASIARSFYWFDVINNETTPLRIHPFMFMDVTFKNYLGYTVQQSKEEAEQIISQCKQVDGECIFIWHNSSFSELDGWSSWTGLHEYILQNALSSTD